MPSRRPAAAVPSVSAARGLAAAPSARSATTSAASTTSVHRPARLPGRAVIVVRTRRGVVRGIAGAARRQPDRAAAAVVLAPLAKRSWDSPFVWLAALLIVLGVGYGLGMLAVSRREPRRRAAASGVRQPGAAAAARTSGLFFVFLMPCLNEEKVLPTACSGCCRSPATTSSSWSSTTDRTTNRRGHVRQCSVSGSGCCSRKPPRPAGKGRGAQCCHPLADRQGLLERPTPGQSHHRRRRCRRAARSGRQCEVTPYFADPTVGAVQIGVRINNREISRLARMQDMEFVIYTEVFQRGRRHLGSVGLGGNGQFMRLSALLSLGNAPWTRSLTEDLDLGRPADRGRLAQRVLSPGRGPPTGRGGAAAPDPSAVAMVPGPPAVLEADPAHPAPRAAPGPRRPFLSPASPAILLIASLLSASFVLSLADCVVSPPEGRNPLGWWIASTYALTFGPALVYGYVYWLRERARASRWPGAAWFAHLYVCYGMMWYASGWWAVGRTLRGRTGWAKTDRVTEAPLALLVLEPLPAARAGASARRLGARRWPPRPASAAAPRRSAAVSGSRRRAVGSSRAAAPRPRCATARHRDCGAPRRVTPLPLLRCARHPCPRRGLRGHSAGGTAAANGGPVFSGYGHTTVERLRRRGVISLSPHRPGTTEVTHAALVISAEPVQRLRRHAAGRDHAPAAAGHRRASESLGSRLGGLALPLRPALLRDDAGGERVGAVQAGSGLSGVASGSSPPGSCPVPGRAPRTASESSRSATRSRSPPTAGCSPEFTDTQRPYLTGAFGLYARGRRRALRPRSSSLSLRHRPESAGQRPGKPSPLLQPAQPTDRTSREGTGNHMTLPKRHVRRAARPASRPGWGDQAPDHGRLRHPARGDESRAAHPGLAESPCSPRCRGDRAAPFHARPGQRRIRDQARRRSGHPPAGADAHRHHHPCAARRPGGRWPSTHPMPSSCRATRPRFSPRRWRPSTSRSRSFTSRRACAPATRTRRTRRRSTGGSPTGSPRCISAPTGTSRANLVAENVPPESIVVTGNTVIDALLWAVAVELEYGDPALADLDRTSAPVLLVTAHRRESWGAPMQAIGRALARIAGTIPICAWSFPSIATRWSGTRSCLPSVTWPT